MGKWLAQFLDEIPGNQTDKTDILPDSGSVSGMSVPLSAIPAEKSSSLGAPPASPLPAYCFVAYTDSLGKLRGGWEERPASTVKQCHGVGAACQVELSNGNKIPLQAVRAVGQLNAEGRLIGAWSVRDHGYDGNG